MKAIIKITIMLMAITIGSLEASAQSARREATQRDPKRSAPAVESRQQKSAPENNRSVSNRTQVRSRASYERPQGNSRVVEKRPSVIQQNNSPSVNRGNSRINSSVSSEKSGATSPPRSANARSNYRSSQQNLNKGNTFNDPKPSVRISERPGNQVVERPRPNVIHSNEVRIDKVYGHYYYPSKRVKMHVHPVTYHNHYRVMYYPSHLDIIWTRKMHRYYLDIYPGYYWGYPVGYRINTISAFEARYNIGEVTRVYGRVYATWFNRETDDLLLFFGGEYPNQEFTMIVPGNIARRFSWRPERYFLGQHVFATGLITSFEGRPEMVVKRRGQLEIY